MTLFVTLYYCSDRDCTSWDLLFFSIEPRSASKHSPAALRGHWHPQYLTVCGTCHHHTYMRLLALTTRCCCASAASTATAAAAAAAAPIANNRPFQTLTQPACLLHHTRLLHQWSTPDCYSHGRRRRQSGAGAGGGGGRGGQGGECRRRPHRQVCRRRRR